VYKEAVLELNASDDRHIPPLLLTRCSGIDVVRNRIKAFAQKKVTLPPGRHKIIILDEADSMTSGAQQALRRIMEIYADTTRFALACNLSSKIIEPIQSRCATLRYTKPSDKQILRRIKEICDMEGVEYDPEGLESILFTAEGDMRQAVNNLQSTYYGFGRVTAANVFRVCDQPHPVAVKEILQSCVYGDVDGALREMNGLWRLGYSALDIITTLFRVVKVWEGMEEGLQLEFIREIGGCHMRILEGTGSLTQLYGLVARLCKLTMPPEVFSLD
jgi:replication factor C subunit 2/4